MNLVRAIEPSLLWAIEPDWAFEPTLGVHTCSGRWRLIRACEPDPGVRTYPGRPHLLCAFRPEQGVRTWSGSSNLLWAFRLSWALEPVPGVQTRSGRSSLLWAFKPALRYSVLSQVLSYLRPWNPGIQVHRYSRRPWRLRHPPAAPARVINPLHGAQQARSWAWLLESPGKIRNCRAPTEHDAAPHNGAPN